LQQYQIRLQEDELQQKQSEFETVTTNMTEGIVLLNSKGSILSINKAALKLFGENDTCIGKDILTINHSLELQDILQKSENGIRSEKVVTLGNGKYQLAVSPILLNEQLSGTVILLLDVTEKEKVEQMRREFTANVSHELKTPLHLISGYSELLSNGIVKQEDITKFSTQIYTETKRMICLVEDILKLSHLDEGAEDMSFVEVNLYELAKDTLKMLSTQAEFTNVELILNGENTILYGIPQLLQGIIYNLCDNAIKYNRQGGSVTVVVKQENQNIILSVCDTGIGIPIEHQERIFERFYRVDKSHSKEIGGTGLGLSIVKHAVRLHNATIELFSEVNKGTTITVKFPVNNKIGF
jgi:two-component system phosphate regulon sensor histidine kinase PhoR